MPMRPLDLDAILSGPPPTRDWLVRDLFPFDNTILLGAHPGIGKSYFTLDLALAIASGQPFLGRQTDQDGLPLPVVYIDQENDLQTVHERIFRLAHGRELTASDLSPHFHYFHIQLPFCHSPADVALALIPVVADIQPCLLVLDTWPSVMPFNDENDNASAARSLAALRLIQAANPAPMSTVALCHLSKGTGDIRGAGHLKGATDATYYLRRSSRPDAQGITTVDLVGEKSRAAGATQHLRLRLLRYTTVDQLIAVAIRPDFIDDRGK